MNLTENTKVRIRVPKHLYESIQAELAKNKMEEGDYGQEDAMEEGEEINEYDPKVQGAMDVLSSIPGIDKIAQIDPFFAGVTLVGMLAGGLIAAPAIEKGIKALMAKIKDPKKKAKLAAAAEKGGVQVDGAEAVQEVEELEEVLDLESLMEAVKDASKKKADEKKKKEAEAKKKKEAEDKKKADEKKKKEAEAKKKADAAKKK
jgi:hypothetical protein